MATSVTRENAENQRTSTVPAVANRCFLREKCQASQTGSPQMRHGERPGRSRPLAADLSKPPSSAQLHPRVSRM